MNYMFYKNIVVVWCLASEMMVDVVACEGKKEVRLRAGGLRCCALVAVFVLCRQQKDDNDSNDDTL